MCFSYADFQFIPQKKLLFNIAQLDQAQYPSCIIIIQNTNNRLTNSFLVNLKITITEIIVYLNKLSVNTFLFVTLTTNYAILYLLVHSYKLNGQSNFQHANQALCRT